MASSFSHISLKVFISSPNPANKSSGSAPSYPEVSSPTVNGKVR
jgi:hypothetical protein